MNDRYVSVTARIRLLSAAEGGRTAPLRRGSYRPNHNFFGPDDRTMTVGFIDLPDGTELEPGGTIDVPMTFWNWPGLEGKIYPGREWRIQEGAKLVGVGTVLEVLAPIGGLTDTAP
jgi:elongation factor Tu